ncbi:MAG: NAD(P)/FAD-dependent oxidoreductase [Planctomycetaceae bacterium]|nr:NAD(P)/FAD-dependent oxidoreductase [Planctomycetaceae bacterium]
MEGRIDGNLASRTTSAVVDPKTVGRPRVVIVGGGFGGLNAALALRKAAVDVTLVDRRNFHLFQPLLYQVATGALSPANIAAPLRGVLRKTRNATVLLAEVVAFDAANRRVVLDDGELSYDSLIVAAGSTHSYFGHDEWSSFAPGLKTIEDATEMRRRILFAFERAERETDPEIRKHWMTFVVVGGGPTGVELAGALSEIARHTLRHDFRHINPAEARVILIDATDRVLMAYPPDLSERAERDLKKLRVDVRTGTLVTDVGEGYVVVTRHGQSEQIASWTVLWAAGVQASPLAKKLADACGVDTDRAGRIKVMPDCTVPNFPSIFAVGDMANCPGPDGKPLPGVAPVAIQQARFAAKVIQARMAGGDVPTSFIYRDQGMMATIGRRKAVAKIGRAKFRGAIAWYMWLFVHLMQLVQFQSRLMVLLQWAWSYLTFNRSARLITGKMLAVKTKVLPAGSAASIGDPDAADTDHTGLPVVEHSPRSESASPNERRAEVATTG